MVNTDLACRNNAYLLTKEGVAYAIDMLDGAVILGAFIVKSQAEAVSVLACLIQSDSDIAFASMTARSTASATRPSRSQALSSTRKYVWA